MATKHKKSNPVEDIRNLEKTVGKQLEEVEKTIKTFEDVRDHLDKKYVERIEPLIETLRRDCKVHSGKVSRTAKSIEGIGRPKRVEQYMRVHEAGTEMYQLIDTIATATLPVVAEVMSDIEEGISNASRRHE